jgi:hypothetical protein
MQDPRQKLYPQISKGVAGFAAVITFIGAYIYCISEYAFYSASARLVSVGAARRDCLRGHAGAVADCAGRSDLYRREGVQLVRAVHCRPSRNRLQRVGESLDESLRRLASPRPFLSCSVSQVITVTPIVAALIDRGSVRQCP